jgi:putative ABC transport system permease protein
MAETTDRGGELRRLKNACGLAVDAILAHKLRSFLTLLGVVIGVASVVLVGAGIEGLGMTAEETTARAFGTNTWLLGQIANVGRLSRKELADKLRFNKQLRMDDVRYLEATTGDQIYYSPYMQRFDDLKRGNQTLEGAAIIGAAASLPDIRDVAVLEGRFFNDQEEKNRQLVGVIGDEVKEKLFAGSNPLGKTVSLNGYEFTVVGVQEKLGSNFGRSQDNNLYIPVWAFMRIYGAPKTISIFGSARKESGLSLEESLDVARSALRTRFRQLPGAPDRFDFLTPDSIRAFLDTILGAIRKIVVPVTLLSLVVGGIVIMNIMLVSVTERTREIGVRKALGALRGDIMMQFMSESIMVSALGGLVGIALAWGVVELAMSLNLAKLRITPPYVALAIFVSSTVGLVSGAYPAWRASRLDPVEALRAD